MPKRNYSNVATPQTLSGAVSDTATTLTVGSTAGYPEVPFLLGLERGTANEEVVLCTAKAATTFTVTRAYDSTVAKAHAAGALVEHTVAAIDFRQGSIMEFTTTERDALLGQDLWVGRIIFNTTDSEFQGYDGAVWAPLADLDTVRAAEYTPADGNALPSTYPNGVTIGSIGAGTAGFPASFAFTLLNVKRAASGRHYQELIATTSATNWAGIKYRRHANSDDTWGKWLLVSAEGATETNTYTSGKLTQVQLKRGSTVIKTTTLTYTGDQLTTITEDIGGVTTITTTLNYTGSDLTSTSKVIA